MFYQFESVLKSFRLHHSIAGLLDASSVLGLLHIGLPCFFFMGLPCFKFFLLLWVFLALRVIILLTFSGVGSRTAAILTSMSVLSVFFYSYFPKSM